MLEGDPIELGLKLWAAAHGLASLLITDPASVAARLSATPGVVDHGLFGPELVSDVLVAHGSEIEHRTVE